MLQVALLTIILVLLVAVAAMAALLLLRSRSGAGERAEAKLGELAAAGERLERSLKEDFSLSREEAARHALAAREETGGLLKNSADSLTRHLAESSRSQQERLDAFSARLAQLSETSERRMGELREAMEKKILEMQRGNEAKLDEMRKTVDEKLQGALEKRLGESFKQVSERLEQVYRGLGEMRQLAADVGDFKRVLTNVKSRGTWGEVQLSAILEQLLTPDQYERNFRTSGGIVEYAVRLPGAGADEPVWLPIDAKFPQEDYLRLVEAADRADAPGVELAAKELSARLLAAARDISEKYVRPPLTTDFGIMFLPTEGLYAEALRRPGLAEELQTKYRVVAAGPTTLAALLNSLRMGFRTLAIEKRSSEVWKVLGAVKTEFGKFNEVLDRVRKKLQEASNTMDQAGTRTRAIERSLREVEELPAGETPLLPGAASEQE